MAAVAAGARPSRDERLGQAALQDVVEDCADLLDVARAGRAAASAFREILRSPSLPRGLVAALDPQAGALATRYGALATRLLALARARSDATSADTLAAERGELAAELRALQSVLGGVLAAPEWQSPAFLASCPAASATGVRPAPVVAHRSDYKRDRHREAAAYEARYLAQLPNGRDGLRAFLTSCGMAALTTILGVLRSEGSLERVVVGRGAYHETHELLGRERGRVHLVDEADTAALLAAVSRRGTTAVVLDALSTGRQTAVPDLPAVCEALARRRTAVALVVDATALAAAGEVAAACARRGVRAFVFESLVKHGQHGFDRANAGMVVVRERDAPAVSRAREHLGTNVADVAALMLPPPDRRLRERRLRRVERNATILARRLQAAVGRADARVEAISYPGLPGRPAHERASPLPFRGGCLSVCFRPGVSAGVQAGLVRRTIELARREGVPLAAGASFGLDVTRVYPIASGVPPAPAFVRVAAGIEHRLAIERVADVLEEALLGQASSR